MNRKMILLFSAVLALVAAGGALAVERGEESGVPAAIPPIAMPDTEAGPSAAAPGLDDSGSPRASLPATSEGLDLGDSLSGQRGSSTGLTASTFLSRLPVAHRARASLSLELPRNLAEAVTGRAREAELSWAAGRHDAVLAVVRDLERNGVQVNVAVSYRDPIPSEGPTLGSNVQIAANVVGEAATDTALDIDRHTGNLIAVGRAPGSFAVFLSTTGGNSWVQSAAWCCDPGELDLAAVGGWGYILYDVPGSNDVRLRRVYGTTGAFDDVYFWQSAVTYLLTTVPELALAGNADTFDNRVALATRFATGGLAWAWTDASTATAFNRSDPALLGVDGGLSMSYIHHWDGVNDPYLMMAVRDNLNAVWVLRRSNSGTWMSSIQVASGVYAGSATSISAYETTALVAYTVSSPGLGAEYQISYDQGANWNMGTLVAADEGGDFHLPLVSARSGSGTAGLAQEEAGTFDNLVFRERHDYAPGVWMALQPLNDQDFITYSSAVDFEYLWSGWGVTYGDNVGAIWFTLSKAIFYSGFERSTTDDWSAVLP